MVRLVLQTSTAFVIAGLLAGCFDGPPFPPGEALERPSASPSATVTATPSPEPSDAPLWLSSPEPQPSNELVIVNPGPNPYICTRKCMIPVMPSPIPTESPGEIPSIVVVTPDRTVDAEIELEPGGALTVILTKTSSKPAIVSLKNHGRWSSVVQCTGLDGSDDYRTQTSMYCDSLDAKNPVKIEMGVSRTVVQFVPEDSL